MAPRTTAAPITTLGFAALVSSHGDDWRREASRIYGAGNTGTPEQRRARAIVLSNGALSSDAVDYVHMRYLGRGA